HRTVDMRGIAEKEGAPLAEAFRDPVMYAVRREPIDALDLDREPAHHAAAHVLPRQLVARMLGLAAQRPDQSHVTPGLQRKHDQEVAVVERAVQLVVQYRPVRLYVRHVEEVRISTSPEPNAKRIAHRG